MWGEKKPEAPARTPLPQQPRPTSSTPASAPSFPGEARTMAPLDSTYNTPSSSMSGGVARLGASLHVKGEITGNEDLAIDGSVEAWFTWKTANSRWAQAQSLRRT